MRAPQHLTPAVEKALSAMKLVFIGWREWCARICAI
jgi:hypothetical protein